MMNSAHLVLIPTLLERGILEPLIHRREETSIHVCGFGAIGAAARSAQLIATLRPTRVTLVGIAGTLSDVCQMGSAYQFGHVICDGIGVGTGADYLSAADLGWNQMDEIDGKSAITDRVALESDTSNLGLLSVCATSASSADTNRRLRRYSDVVAEDMEGFAVALACRLADVPLRIIRGISNHAGDRDLSAWQMETALQSAAELLNR
ncbi:futalosine hydrolase [Novipirellula artificiosorum]|uniref:Futalosine hydrolase n=1 Tax=Novipirellula artificiosorum TaxID=2528016 RepID=A0A5C6DVS0_9BACT|nr:futalosine hydrolase [Novipirellula artificiosorum]TWU40455.1 Futalosine hydrolase [Novipirellula artificiosorum]